MKIVLLITSHFSKIGPGASGLQNCRARKTVKLQNVETPDFIPPNLWPPNSPDLNPVDYKIWGSLQERVYKTSIKDIDELRCRIAEEWDKLDLRIIDKAVAAITR